MRTTIAIQMQAESSDGTPASGVVCLKANVADFSTPTVYSGQPTCGVLDIYGRLVNQYYNALTCWASDDAGFSTVYTFTLDLDGQEQDEFQCYVPGASSAEELAAQTTDGSDIVTLTSLIACNSMLGQSIVGDNWPDDTIVQAISVIYNTVTLSNEATETGTCTATVGGAVLMETLIANKL